MEAVDSILIEEVSLEDVMHVHDAVPEFVTEFPYTIETFRERTEGKKTVCLVASADGEKAGYIVAYERDQDGSFYCWMAGVAPAFRRRGILRVLMQYLESWAKKNGYVSLAIKTRNNRREMLSFLVKEGFLFTGVEPHELPEENRILLNKSLL